MRTFETDLRVLSVQTREGIAITGRQLILNVEDLQNRLAAQTLQKNAFWRGIVESPQDVPDRIYHGLCVENYHMLFRESYFDAPILSYPLSRNARKLINEFYCEELGHDELLLKSLESIGLERNSLFNSVPLPGTLALCNALSFWARHDPLFFFTTLGPLEGRDVEVDSFVVGARAKGLPDGFVGPIEAHANINKNAAHGLLTRDIFDSIPAISHADADRIMRQTPLFIAIYDRFYSNIWEYYGGDGGLIRPISDL
jgi:hypothetical protein